MIEGQLRSLVDGMQVDDCSHRYVLNVCHLRVPQPLSRLDSMERILGLIATIKVQHEHLHQADTHTNVLTGPPSKPLVLVPSASSVPASCAPAGQWEYHIRKEAANPFPRDEQYEAVEGLLKMQRAHPILEDGIVDRSGHSGVNPMVGNLGQSMRYC